MLIYLQLMESDEDKQRFTALYEAHHARVEQIALHILQDPHDAEDAVQNTFSRLSGILKKQGSAFGQQILVF